MGGILIKLTAAVTRKEKILGFFLISWITFWLAGIGNLKLHTNYL